LDGGVRYLVSPWEDSNVANTREKGIVMKKTLYEKKKKGEGYKGRV